MSQDTTATTSADAFACNLCPAIITDAAAFVQHQTTVHAPRPWPQVVHNAVPEMFGRVLELCDGTGFICAKCGFRDTHYDAVIRHCLYTHHRPLLTPTVNGIRYACASCPKTFVLMNVYLAHRCTGNADRAYVSKHQTFRCLEPGCSVVCRTQPLLKQHMRTTGHAGGDRFRCSACHYDTPYYYKATAHPCFRQRAGGWGS